MPDCVHSITGEHNVLWSMSWSGLELNAWCNLYVYQIYNWIHGVTQSGPNPKPWTENSRHWPLNHKPQTLKPEPYTPNPKLHPEPHTPNPHPEPNPTLHTPQTLTLNLTLHSKPFTPNPKPSTLNTHPNPLTQTLKPDHTPLFAHVQSLCSQRNEFYSTAHSLVFIGSIKAGKSA